MGVGLGSVWVGLGYFFGLFWVVFGLFWLFGFGFGLWWGKFCGPLASLKALDARREKTTCL